VIARTAAIVAGICWLVAPLAVPAAEHAVDPGLLEYLGSVDSEDKDWHDYLAHTDIDQVARRAGQPRRAPPPPAAQPPASSKPPPVVPAAPPVTAP
jgi:hypothetical protein